MSNTIENGEEPESIAAAARMAIGDDRMKFAYFIPHPPQDLNDASFFGFYTPGIHASEGMLLAASTLPADIREPFTSPAIVLKFRLLRMLWRTVIPVGIKSLRALTLSELVQPVPLFRVILTNNVQIAEEVDKLGFADGLPFLHVSPVQGANRISPEQLSAASLVSFANSVLAHLDREPKYQKFVAWARESIAGDTLRRPKRHPMGSAMHNVTSPNEAALTSFGWVFDRATALVPEGRLPPDARRYISRICSLADDVTVRRAALMRTGNVPASVCDWVYIVTVPSIHWGHYKSGKENAERLSKAKFLAARMIYEAAVKQTSYFDRYETPSKGIGRDLINAPEFRWLLGTRAQDQRCYTAGLALLASQTLAPVLRIEPKVNQVRGNLRELAVSVRAGNGGSPQLKASRLARSIAEKLRGLVDGQFLNRLDRYQGKGTIQGMKLVADLPLEWLPIGGLPLMLRYDVSRIPLLPGNIFIQHCVRPPVLVYSEAFAKVLVIRSFRADDPLRGVLERAITRILESSENTTTQVTFRDVTTRGELLAAIKSCEGAMLILDCHGGYNEQTGVGTIVVGGDPVEVWDLREECDFPPIVIFSACDTHPIDGSHGSVANAAFVLGAVSVLGTVLPIRADTAAMFIGRLIFRISEFIPEALKFRNLLTWREVISGMIRMAYTTEVRRILTGQAGWVLRPGGEDRVQYAANMAINNRASDWFDRFVSAMAVEAERKEPEVRAAIARWASLTDSLKYVQLGSPENIVIVPGQGPD
jgi:hypothetical protein